jgi:hypothetical protein
VVRTLISSKNPSDNTAVNVNAPRLGLLTSLVTVALVGLTCQDYLFDQKCPERVREAQVAIAEVRPTPADILFVVDNSGSMEDEQRNLADNFDRFINEIAGSGDYRIAVVTTDLSAEGGDRGEESGAVTFAFRGGPYYGLNLSGSTRNCLPTVFNDQDAVPVPIPHGCFRGPKLPDRVINSTTLDRETQILRFQENVLVGTCGDGTEQGLAAMITALEESQGGCNNGFLRDNANLVVVFVADENDASCSNCDELDEFGNPQNLIPVSDFVTRLRDFKPYARIRVASIVGSVDGEPDTCNVAKASGAGTCGNLCSTPPAFGTNRSCTSDTDCVCQPGDGCVNASYGEFCNLSDRCENREREFWNDVWCGWCSFYNVPQSDPNACCSALAGNRYIEFARAIEAQVNQGNSQIPITNCRGGSDTRIACLVDSICQDNFGDTLARIARELVLNAEFVLDPPATYPAGVTVKVKNGRFPPDGLTLTYGTDFLVSEDGSTLTIINRDKVPQEGEAIDIFFAVDPGQRSEPPRGACVE